MSFVFEATARIYPGASPISAALFERAQGVMPGGNTRTTVYRSPHQIYVAFGSGCRVTDVDGHERVDWLNNYTAAIHGHARPELVAAASEAIARGSSFGLATESEIALAELLCARSPGLERVRFTNSGGEAVMMAIKAARAYTGRSKIAKCEGAFHGTADFAEVSVDSAPDNWGPPERPASVPSAVGAPKGMLSDVIALPFNDVEASGALLDEHTEHLAAVLFDPLPNRIGFIAASPEYVESIVEFCRRTGALLISDEVMSFRLGPGGAQEAFGYRPDLTTLGKIIGGGFPVGAVGGREEVMSVFDPMLGKPRVPHGGTFNANPVTMTTGRVAMELLTQEAFDELNELGSRVRRGLTAVLSETGSGWQVAGKGSLFRIHPTSAPLVDYRTTRPSREEAMRFGRFVLALLNDGVLLDSSGMGCVSTAMRGAEVIHLIDAVRGALHSAEDCETMTTCG